MMFADSTNRVDTYEAGRYLYIDHEDADGRVLLDFNKSYNPPCAFTPYATCPFPPEQNYLPLSVTSGEKRYAKNVAASLGARRCVPPRQLIKRFAHRCGRPAPCRMGPSLTDQ